MNSEPTSSAGPLSRHLKKLFVLPVLLAGMAFGISSCETEEVVPDPINSGPISICPPYDSTQTPGGCIPDTYVTVRHVTCGLGAFGSLWLQLDNGDYLQPWGSNPVPPLAVGQRYKVNYVEMQRDNRYDSIITCMAALPPSTAIRINCMEEVPVSNPITTCSVIVRAEDVGCGYGVWRSMYLKLPDGSHLQPFESTTAYPMLQHGENYQIGYELMQPDSRYDTAVICQALPIGVTDLKVARITCIQPAP